MTKRSLPAWVYTDPDFFALECREIFRCSWQLVCHVADVSEPGDYYVFELLGTSIFVLRGQDRRLRAFHNVCRHRAARLLDAEPTPAGHCADARIRCPYHAWAYDLQGRLVNVPQEQDYRELDKREWGLHEVALETWQGFIFVSIDPAGPAVAEIMAPFAEEIESHRLCEMKPLGRITLRPRAVNWKTIVDNYIDGLHIRVAHPGLRALVGKSYSLHAHEYVQHMRAELQGNPRAPWSARAYVDLADRCRALPSPRRRWSYYMLWPNVAFDVYPDQIDFMQMIPVSPSQTLIREVAYGRNDDSRELRLLRYLNWRINRQVNAEDTDLIGRVQAGMASGSFSSGPFAESEVCLHRFAEKMREVLPVCTRDQPPATGRLHS